MGLREPERIRREPEGMGARDQDVVRRGAIWRGPGGRDPVSALLAAEPGAAARTSGRGGGRQRGAEGGEQGGAQADDAAAGEASAATESEGGDEATQTAAPGGRRNRRSSGAGRPDGRRGSGQEVRRLPQLRGGRTEQDRPGAAGRGRSRHRLGRGLQLFERLAARRSGVWDYRELWMPSSPIPEEWAPGTKMAFAGVKKAEERADLIVYLRSITDGAAAAAGRRLSRAAPWPARWMSPSSCLRPRARRRRRRGPPALLARADRRRAARPTRAR